MFQAHVYCFWLTVVVWAVLVHNNSIGCVVVEGCIDPFSSTSLDSLCGEVAGNVVVLKSSVTDALVWLTRQHEAQGTGKEGDVDKD